MSEDLGRAMNEATVTKHFSSFGSISNTAVQKETILTNAAARLQCPCPSAFPYSSQRQPETHALIIPLLVQLIDEPILVVWRAASAKDIGTSAPVVGAHAHVAALVEEPIQRRYARGAG